MYAIKLAIAITNFLFIEVPHAEKTSPWNLYGVKLL